MTEEFPVSRGADGPEDRAAPRDIPGSAHPAQTQTARAQPHDSGPLHVTGRATYTDDIATPPDTLHGYLGLSPEARGQLNAVDLSAVRAAPGVTCVLTAADLIHNDASPTNLEDEPLLADGEIRFHNQAVFLVVATTRDAARRAARLAKFDITPVPAITDVVAAIGAGYPDVTAPLALCRGDAEVGLSAAPRRIAGRMRVGGQDHFYLEGQITLAIPGEGAEMVLWCSTQHPTEVQHMVAQALGVMDAQVVVNVRRVGGGFGGKETQMNQFACLAAVAARRLGRPVKLRPDRDDDMALTGKRHDFAIDYDLGYDESGRILAVDATLAARAGHSSDLSGPVTDRACFHADNAYFYPDVRLRSRPVRTDTVSNTAFRGFGGPQGVMLAERLIEEVAYATGLDPLEVRRNNLYGRHGDLTPYHQTVDDNILDRLIDELSADCNYAERRSDIIAHNAKGGVIRRGIALTPVKFGISFTATWLNQAGALVLIYVDGSIAVSHGGIEMGQGLHTKIRQVVAENFGVETDTVRIAATATDKVPNTSATAASSGTDLNGMAAQDACDQIIAKLKAFAQSDYGATPVYRDGMVTLGSRTITFAEFIRSAYMARVQLSASGYYRTPDIHWNRDTGQGQPFYYFAYGAACAEVEVDLLTGENRTTRVDILHDVGRSLNPALDLGQVEGGFIQGMGWLTTEELVWDAAGKLQTHAPSTYKIPLASDLPQVFNVKLADWSENARPTIRRSKAVGEPPFMLAASVFEALGMAVASVADYRHPPRLDSPATPEQLLFAAERLRACR